MNSLSSNKKLNTTNILKILEQKGLNQSSLAKELSVSREIVSQWLQNKKYPRPRYLLKLSEILNIEYNELVTIDKIQEEPIIAFRKKGHHKIDEEYKQQAKLKGYILEKLIQYLPFEQKFQHSSLVNPENSYEYIQKIASYVRSDILFNDNENLDIEKLINFFKNRNAIIIPVFWGNISKHENALHIYLPKTKTTWIYLNLDTNIIDFKFWISHEIGHILDPDRIIDETDVSEDFADSFAGALLFPEKLVLKEYLKLKETKSIGTKINQIKNLAKKYQVSPITIFSEINKYATNYKKPLIYLNSIYPATTNLQRSFKKVSEILFKTKNPSAKDYINISCTIFKTPFFNTLKDYIIDTKSSPHLIERLLDISYPDALSLYEELN